MVMFGMQPARPVAGCGKDTAMPSIAMSQVATAVFQFLQKGKTLLRL